MRQRAALGWAKHLEAAAHSFADSNEVEVAWFLRGVSDALDGYKVGKGEAGEEYEDDWQAGWDSVRRWQAM